MTNLLELGLCGFYQNNGSCVAELSVGLILAKPMVAWALPNKGLVKTFAILFLMHSIMCSPITIENLA